MGRRCQATSMVNTYSDLPIRRRKIVQNVIHNGRFRETLCLLPQRRSWRAASSRILRNVSTFLTKLNSVTLERLEINIHSRENFESSPQFYFARHYPLNTLFSTSYLLLTPYPNMASNTLSRSVHWLVQKLTITVSVLIILSTRKLVRCNWYIYCYCLKRTITFRFCHKSLITWK